MPSMHKGDLIKFKKKRRYWTLEDYQSSVKKLQDLGWTQKEIEQFIHIRIKDGEMTEYYRAGSWCPSHWLKEIDNMNKDEQITNLKNIISSLISVIRDQRMSDRFMESLIDYAKDTYGVTEKRIDWPNLRKKQGGH